MRPRQALFRARSVPCALLLATLPWALPTACAHEEGVAPGEVLRGDEDAAMRAAGVRARVYADPALALPSPAEGQVTAVRLVLENHGDEPVRLRYRELWLIEPDGRLRLALPPFVNGRAPPEGVRTAFGHTRFFVAPGYERVHTTLAAWSGPFQEDPYYGPTHFARWTPPLPTPEMVSRALPEGVLEPGGRLDGLVYFEGVSALSSEMTLVAELVNARTGGLMGTLHVPFQPKRAATYSTD